MQSRDLRKPMLGKSVGAIIVGAVVTLAGCAAQPVKTENSAETASQQDADPVASKPVVDPIDFHTLKETTCPQSASSYQEWVAKFQAYALSKGRPDNVIQLAFAGV